MAPPQSGTKPSKILVLTDFYPVGLQETFVTPTLETTSTFFDHVTIIPTNLESEVEGGMRKVPENVTILLETWKLARESWSKLSIFSKLSLSLPFIFSSFMERYRHSTPISEFLGEAAYARHFSKYIETTINIKEYQAVSAYWLNRPASIASDLKRRHPHLRFISRAHRGDILPRENRKTIPFQPTIVKYADEIHVVSQDGVDTLKSIHPKASDKIVVGRLGTTNHEQTPHRSVDGCLRIISMSRIVDVKRVDLIARALAFVSRPLHWTHFGTGPGMKELQELVASLPDNIDVSLPGFIESHSEIHSTLESKPWDILVNVSTSEGVPASIQECFSYGIPAIATDVGGNPEIVDSTCGHLLPPNPSPEEIASILQEWDINNESRRTAALNRQREMYDVEKNAREYANSLSSKL